MSAKPPVPLKPLGPPLPPELHFFPGAKEIIWVVDGEPALRAEAWGGATPAPGVRYETMAPRRTTPGTYVIHSYAPYRTSTWALSRIAWGTKLMPDFSADRILYQTGSPTRPWANAAELVPGLTLAKLQETFVAMFGEHSLYDSNGDRVPDVWVFNDFGPMAVRYFKDKNGNRRLDGNERLSGEMFHTTPKNEAEAATSQSVVLENSHGCIHVSPSVREVFHDSGAFNRGVTLIIHRYDESIPPKFR